VYLPGQGSFFLEQRENRWHYLRDVVVAAYRSSANTWKGTWRGIVSSGPGALGTALVSGGSGEFSDQEMLAVESLSTLAWAVDGGPISASGALTIELPDAEVDVGE
jgi:hypothetical protein